MLIERRVIGNGGVKPACSVLQSLIVKASASESPPWKILLLGGGAAVGKSTVAARIARRYQTSLVPTDFVWLALQTVTDPTAHPELHYFDPAFSDFSLGAERLSERHVKTASAVSECLEPVVASLLLRDNERAVIEGAWITPLFAARKDFDGVESSGRVFGVFIHEPELTHVLHLMAARRRLSRPTRFQRLIARVCWLQGNWLAAEAARLGLPVIPARPQRSLVSRVLAAAHETPRHRTDVRTEN